MYSSDFNISERQSRSTPSITQSQEILFNRVGADFREKYLAVIVNNVEVESLKEDLIGKQVGGKELYRTIVEVEASDSEEEGDH